MFWVKPITTCHQFASMHPITYSSDQTPNPETTKSEFFHENVFNVFKGLKINLFDENKQLVPNI